MRTRIASLTLMIGLAALTAAPALARGPRAKLAMAATGALPQARGKANVAMRDPSTGFFKLRVQRLQADTDYDVLVGGIRVATLHTTHSGSGGLRFASQPRGSELLLGFDPRGQAIELRSAAGENVLIGSMPLIGDDTGKVACCLPDDSGSECEDRTAEECTAQGGTATAAGSCLPDRAARRRRPTSTSSVACPTIPAPSARIARRPNASPPAVRWSRPTSCVDNPCAGTPLPPDENVQCCIPAYYVYECEDRTVAECEALGGINKGAGECSPNPCGALPPSSEHGVCCLPNAAGDEIECEDRSPTTCTEQGGVVKSGGVCDPTTCADVPPPNPDVMCCLPNLTGSEIECEDRTADACAAAGGVSKGAGVCALDTCADVPPPTPDVMCCVPDSHGVARCEDRSEARCADLGGTVIGAGSCPAVDPCG